MKLAPCITHSDARPTRIVPSRFTETVVGLLARLGGRQQPHGGSSDVRNDSAGAARYRLLAAGQWSTGQHNTTSCRVRDVVATSTQAGRNKQSTPGELANGTRHCCHISMGDMPSISALRVGRHLVRARHRKCPQSLHATVMRSMSQGAHLGELSDTPRWI